MTRSFWRIPRGDLPGNCVAFDESPQFLYVIAAEEERPDLEVVGTLLGKSVKAMNANNRARFLRIEVERDTPENEPAGKIRVLIKASNKKPGDVEKRTNVPAVIWAGDDPTDYLP